jgi:hypothetical protein
MIMACDDQPWFSSIPHSIAFCRALAQIQGHRGSITETATEVRKSTV